MNAVEKWAADMHALPKREYHVGSYIKREGDKVMCWCPMVQLGLSTGVVDEALVKSPPFTVIDMFFKLAYRYAPDSKEMRYKIQNYLFDEFVSLFDGNYDALEYRDNPVQGDVDRAVDLAVARFDVVDPE